MKTETVKLTKTELDYLLSILHDQINSGVYWGSRIQFVKTQNKVLEKITEAYDSAFGHVRIVKS